MIFGGVLVALWLVLLIYTWSTHAGEPGGGWSFWSVAGAVVVMLYWANLGYRYLRAHRGHHYRLTNRRVCS